MAIQPFQSLLLDCIIYQFLRLFIIVGTLSQKGKLKFYDFLYIIDSKDRFQIVIHIIYIYVFFCLLWSILSIFLCYIDITFIYLFFCLHNFMLYFFYHFYNIFLYFHLFCFQLFVTTMCCTIFIFHFLLFTLFLTFFRFEYSVELSIAKKKVKENNLNI